MIKQIGLPLRGRPILLITRMITDRIGLHSVLLPLQITLLRANQIARIASDFKVDVINWEILITKYKSDYIVGDVAFHPRSLPQQT